MKLSEALIKLNEAEEDAYFGQMKIIGAVGDTVGKYVEKKNNIGFSFGELCRDVKNRGGLANQNMSFGADTFQTYLYDKKIKLNPKPMDFIKAFNVWQDAAKKQFQGLKPAIEGFFKKHDLKYDRKNIAKVLGILQQHFHVDLKQFEVALDTARNFASFYEDILRNVNIGMDRDPAIKNIVKMTGTMKGIGNDGKRTGKAFDPMTEDAIIAEINTSHKTVKLRGAFDVYVTIDDKKVTGIQL